MNDQTHSQNSVPASLVRKTQRRSDRLLSALQPYDQIVVLMHDNPDPDAIASGWAVKYLIDQRLGKRTRLIGGGAIVRAENRYLVELLKPPLELVDDLHLQENTGVILVDCGLQAANRLKLEERSGEIVGVIDHHSSSKPLAKLAFQDIRPKLAASATIAAGYLREQNLPPGRALATALLYALKTETRGCQTYFSSTDRAILPWLTRLADPQLLAEIEDAPLPFEYYGDLVLALQNTVIYHDAGFCWMPRAQGTETVGEVADLLIRCEGIHRVLCAATVNGNIAVSVRTSSRGGDAAELVQRTLEGIGHGGGHSNRAGGMIPLEGQQDETPTLADLQALQQNLRDRWLDACSVERTEPRRLISLDEIVDNL